MRSFSRWFAATLGLSAVVACSESSPDPVASDAPGCDSSATAYRVWVTDQGLGLVYVLDHADGDAPGALALLATIDVGLAPHNIVFSPDGRFAYVANLGAPPELGFVSVLDTRAYAVIAHVTTGLKAHGVAVTPDGAAIWAANVSSDDVTVIDAASLAPAATTIAVGDGPAMIAFLHDGSKAYVSNGNGGTTSVIDVATRQVLRSIPTGHGAMGLVVSHDGRMVFETDAGDNRVSAIDTTSDTVVKTLTFGGTLLEPHSVALAGDELIVTNRTEESLAFVDSISLEKTGSVPVPGRPDIIGVAPDCRHAFLTLRDAAAVAVVDLIERTAVAQIELGAGDVHGIAVLREMD